MKGKLTVHGPRGQELINAIGTNVIPVVDTGVEAFAFPSGVQQVYRLDVAELPMQQFAQIAAHLARIRGLTLPQTIRMLLEAGLPILAENTSLVSDEVQPV
jgi:hypothetical protein